MVANILYEGPSYVSIESVLSYYGLIPERTMGMTSVVTGRSKTFRTPIGWFSYKSIPEDLFPIGVRSVDGYLMASPEKALCDYLYTRKDLRNYSSKTLASYLEEDVRFDFDSFANHDPQIFAARHADTRQLSSTRRKGFSDDTVRQDGIRHAATAGCNGRQQPA